VTTEEIRQTSGTAIPGAEAEVSGADQHYSAVVVAPAFEGMSRLERHRMIYALFGGAMATQEIHALSITARTPGERQRATAHVEK